MMRKRYSAVIAAIIPMLLVVTVGLVRAKIDIENGTLTEPIIIISMIILALTIVTIVWGVSVNIERYKRAARLMRSPMVHVWLCMLKGGQYCRLLSVDNKHVTVWKLHGKATKLVRQWDKTKITIRPDQIAPAYSIPMEGFSIYTGNELQQGAVLYDPDNRHGILMHPLKGNGLAKAIAILQSSSI